MSRQEDFTKKTSELVLREGGRVLQLHKRTVKPRQKALLKEKVSTVDPKKPLKCFRARKALRIYPEICTTSFLICLKGTAFNNRNITKSTLGKQREDYKSKMGDIMNNYVVHLKLV